MSIFKGARWDRPNVPRDDTTVEIIRDEDNILPQRNKRETLDIVCFILVQQNIFRS